MEWEKQYSLSFLIENYPVHAPFAGPCDQKCYKKQQQQKRQLLVAEYFAVAHNEDDNDHIRNQGDARQSR